MISVIIPVKYGDDPQSCIDSIKREGSVDEIILVYNNPDVGRVKAKNLGAKIAEGDVLFFIDADSQVGKNFFKEIESKSKISKFVGGGVKHVKLERKSLGIICWLIPVAFYLYWKRITVGAFWVKKRIFEEIGGFRKTKYDDIDFALRLKAYAKKSGLKFESLKESELIVSTRRFDEFGDWHWLKGGYRVDSDLVG